MDDPVVVTETSTALPPFVNERVSWQASLTNALLRRFVKTRLGKVSDIASMRVTIAKLDRWVGQRAKGLLSEERTAAGIACRWLQLPSNNDRVLLYFHGGLFCFHLPRMYAGFTARICHEIGANALIPDYRLAPEHPFPAAVDDCFAAYRWLLEQGYSPDNIVLAGDSAGGCLTLTTLMQIRDADLPMPAAAILISPAADCSVKQRSSLPVDIEADPMFSSSVRGLCYSPYMAGADEKNSLVSPAYGNFHGMPPLQIFVGSSELILSHSLRVVAKASAAGVDVRLSLWKEMPHVHPLMNWLPESKQALQMMGAFFRQHLREL
ncbi:MAG: alpha/beta hydrolase [Amphritea sp.]